MQLLPPTSPQPRGRRSLVAAGLALVALAFVAGAASRPVLGSFVAAAARSSVAPARGGVPAVAPYARAAAVMAEEALDGRAVRVGLIRARGTTGASAPLGDAVKAALTGELQVDPDNIVESEVPTLFDLPLAVRFLALSQTVDVVIPVGVAAEIGTIVPEAFMQVSLATSTPVIPGVVEEKGMGSPQQLGKQWAGAAVEMAMLRQSAFGAKKRSFYGFNAEGEESEDFAGGTPMSPERRQKVGF